jgi:integrase
VVNRSFKPLLKHAGLPNIRFHDLRHTCASLLVSKGVNSKVIQKDLGHSIINVTMDVYSHLMPDMQASTAEAMDDVVNDA